jgi:hypothetical protein
MSEKPIYEGGDKSPLKILEEKQERGEKVIDGEWLKAKEEMASHLRPAIEATRKTIERYEANSMVGEDLKKHLQSLEKQLADLERDLDIDVLKKAA